MFTTRRVRPLHRRRGGASDGEGRREVYGQDSLPGRILHRLDWREDLAQCAAGIVDHHAERTGLALDRRDPGSDGSVVG
jgi:hypothetical protein